MSVDVSSDPGRDARAGRIPGATTEAVVHAFTEAMRRLWTALPGAGWHDSADLVRYDTAILAPRLNGVVVLGPAADEDLAAAWLDGLAARQLPYCILSRPRVPDWVPELAVRHGLDRVEHQPLMVHPTPGTVRTMAPGVVDAGTRFERVDPGDPAEVALAQRLFADGFEGPVEVLGALMTDEVLRLPELSALVGRVDGVPCTTGLGALTEGHVGVFNIATPPPYRGRGHGRAVTAEVVAAGVARGAHTAYLQASEMGYGIYERLGFRTVERWPSYYPEDE